MDDRAIVAAIAGGDPKGLDRAYRRYADKLYGYSLSVVGDPDAARDVVQDVFVLASQRISQLREADRLRPWLYAITRTESLHRLRDRRRATPADVPDDAVTVEPDMVAGAHTSHVRELVRAAMYGLGDADREIIELVVDYDFGIADIAASLDISANHAAARLSRARTGLATCLGALLVARSVSTCADLTVLIAEWDGKLTPLLRKRLNRHIEACALCGALRDERLSPSSLLGISAALPLLFPALSPNSPAGPSPAGPSPAAPLPAAPSSAAPHSAAVGPPPRGGGRRRGRNTAAVGVGVAVLMLLATCGVATVVRPDARFVAADASATGPALAVHGSPEATATPQAAQTGPTEPGITNPGPDEPSPDLPGGDDQPGGDDPPPPPTPTPTPTPTLGYIVVLPALNLTAAGAPRCSSSSAGTYRLGVTARIATSSITSATLRYTVLGVPHATAMTPAGREANGSVTGLRAPSVRWWVEITAADGRTASTPRVTETNPC